MAEVNDPKTPPVTTERVDISVDRSKVEKDLQDEVTAKAVEMAKLHDQLANLTKQLETANQEKGTVSDAMTKLKEEFETTKGQLQDHAMAEFNRQKEERLNILKNAGLDEEKLKDFDEKIQTPADLDASEWMIKSMSEMLEQAKAAQQTDPVPPTGTNTPPVEPPTVQTPPPIVQTGTPPPSVVGLPSQDNKQWIFNSVREGIDDLYARVAKGDREADLKLNQLWQKAIPTLKKTYGKLQMAITQCPFCGGGILAGEKCPYCQFDVAKDYIGGEFW